MIRSIESREDIEVVYHEPKTREKKKKSHFFSWLTSLFHKKVTNQYAEQTNALNFLEREIKSWHRESRRTAVATLHSINVRAYDSMELTPEQRLQLQRRVEELKDIYVVHPGGINYADIVADRKYELAITRHIKQLVTEAQSPERRTALAARREIFDLAVTSEQNSASLNDHLVQELRKAQDAIQALIDSEDRLAAQVEREADILKHQERLTDGGKFYLLGELITRKCTLVATPFSRPLLDEYNAFEVVEELAKLEPGRGAIFQIEEEREKIIAGGAGKELEKVVVRMQKQIEAKIQGLKAKLKKTKKLYEKSAPYSTIHQLLAPVRKTFSTASILRSLEQTIALIEHRIAQLGTKETSSSLGLAADAIDPIQAQQIMQEDDAKSLKKRMETLTAERDRLAEESGLRSDLFEEGRITLRQTAAKATSVFWEEDPVVNQMLSDLNMKQRIYQLVLDGSEKTENSIVAMKAKALIKGRPELVQKIETYYREALGLKGYFFENISYKIQENTKQIARLKEEAEKRAKKVVKEHAYKRMTTLSFELQEIVRIAKWAIKDLGKDHPKLAKRLKKVSLRDLSDATKLGARAHELYFQKASLELHFRDARYMLEQLVHLRPAPRST